MLNLSDIWYQQQVQQQAAMPDPQLVNLQLLDMMKGMAEERYGFNQIFNFGRTDPSKLEYIGDKVEANGYEFGKHNVQTKDGYILEMHRVRKPGLKKGAPVVLLQHGLASVSETWVNNEKDSAVAYLLAEAGFDVWLGNNRGNIFSRKHINIDPEEQREEFYDYSFQELGDYDLPSQIQFALDYTGVSKLSYIGHSQGTTQMFYKLTKDEEWLNERVNMFIAFAPVTKLNNMPSIARGPARLINLGLISLDAEAFGREKVGQQIEKTSENKVVSDFLSIFGSVGSMQNSLESSKWSKVNQDTWYPARVSLKQIKHFIQLFLADDFLEYNYKLTNLWHYGSVSPPRIDLTKIRKVPTALFVGEKDTLASPENSQWIADQIGSLVHHQVLPGYGHGTFNMSNDPYFMSEVIDLLKMA